MVGHANECMIEINNTHCAALLDTGANIFTISTSKYQEIFPDQPIRSVDELKLDIEGAVGHKLPYSVCIEADLIVPGLLDMASCLLLVVPYTDYAKRVPIILGTNVLGLVMDRMEHEYGIRYQQTVHMPKAWYFTFRCMKVQSRLLEKANGMLCILKCALAKKIVVPSNSSLVVDSKTDKMVSRTATFGIAQA